MLVGERETIMMWAEFLRKLGSLEVVGAGEEVN